MMNVRKAKVLLRRIISALRGSSFAKSVLVVMTGTGVAQAVGFALGPVVSRLFTPSDFGVFGSFSAVLTTITAGVTLSFSQAVLLPKDNEDAICVLALSCASTVSVTVSLLVVCLFAVGQVQSLIEAPSAVFVVLLVVASLVGGLQISVQSWSIRIKAFRTMSASQIIRSLSSNGSQVGLGLLKAGAIGIVCATILGDLLAMLTLLRTVLSDLLALRHSIRWQRMKKVAREYSHFPIYSAPKEVINALSRGLPVLLLTNYYSLSVAGAYAFGVRMLSVPMSFVLGALRPVLFQKASEIYNRGDRLVPVYMRFTGGLFLLALVPSAVVLMWAPQVFTWVFGAQWLTAGEFARWLTLWLAAMLCSLPATIFAQVIRMQRQAFFFDIVLIAVRTLSLVAGGMLLSELQTVVVFSVVSCGMSVIWIAVVGVALMKREGGTNWRRMPSQTDKQE
jgi:lipopolysaccharide exporter